MMEIHRVLNPGGRLLILDLSLPTAPISRTVARALFGGMLDHDLRELLPLMGASGFVDVEIAPAKFRVLGLSVLSYVRGRARKS
jgi:ubiquinone/menaquinone biosynthesis C-methylase UbiE